MSSITISGVGAIHYESRDYPRARGLANSYWCPTGVRPGVAYILMLRDEIDSIKGNTSHTLTFSSDGGGSSVSISPLYFSHATKMGLGGSPDNSVYLCKFYDRRILGTRWDTLDQVLVNLHSSGHQLDLIRWIEGTADGASEVLTPVSWQDLIDALWPAALGSAPTLPYTPTSFPHDIASFGIKPWTEILPSIFKRLGLVVVYSGILDTFVLTVTNTAQSLPGGIGLPVYDQDPITGVLDMPETFRAYYWKHSSEHGAEYDSEAEGANWITDPPMEYAEQAADLTGIPGAISGTTQGMWVDHRAEYDHAGSPLFVPQKAAALDESLSYVQGDAKVARLLQRYKGAIAVAPGAQFKAVMYQEFGHGLITEVAGHPGEPVSPYRDREGLCIPESNEAFSAPSVSERGYPTWPRTDQVVRVDVLGEEIGALIDPATGPYYSGKVYKHVNGVMEERESCWINLPNTCREDQAGAFVDDPLAVSKHNVIVNGLFFMARAEGTYSDGATRLPLYQATNLSGGSAPVKVTAQITARSGDTPGSGEVKRYTRTPGTSGAITEFGAAINCYNWHDEEFEVDDRGLMTEEIDGKRWFIPFGGMGTRIYCATVQEDIPIGDQGDIEIEEGPRLGETHTGDNNWSETYLFDGNKVFAIEPSGDTDPWRIIGVKGGHYAWCATCDNDISAGATGFCTFVEGPLDTISTAALNWSDSDLMADDKVYLKQHDTGTWRIMPTGGGGQEDGPWRAVVTESSGIDQGAQGDVAVSDGPHVGTRDTDNDFVEQFLEEGDRVLVKVKTTTPLVMRVVMVAQKHPRQVLIEEDFNRDTLVSADWPDGATSMDVRIKWLMENLADDISASASEPYEAIAHFNSTTGEWDAYHMPCLPGSPPGEEA